MGPRTVLLAEDLDSSSPLGLRRGRLVRKLAQDMSRLLQKDVNLLHVEENLSHHDEHETQMERMLREFTVKARKTFRKGRPAEEILKTMNQFPRPEMVVMGTEGRQGLEKFFLGSVTEEVISKSRRPVMVLGPKAQDRYQKFGLSKPLRILLATDLTRTSRPAEHYACSLAARCGAPVTLFHNPYEQIRQIEDFSLSSGFANFDLDSTQKKIIEESLAGLEQRKLRLRRKMVSCHSILCKEADNLQESLLSAHGGFSFIIMGSHTRNALVRTFLGTSARETILKAEIPVVVVPSLY